MTSAAPPLIFTPRPLSPGEDRMLRRDLADAAQRWPGRENTWPRNHEIDQILIRYGQIPPHSRTLMTPQPSQSSSPTTAGPLLR